MTRTESDSNTEGQQVVGADGSETVVAADESETGVYPDEGEASAATSTGGSTATETVEAAITERETPLTAGADETAAQADETVADAVTSAETATPDSGTDTTAGDDGWVTKTGTGTADDADSAEDLVASLRSLDDSELTELVADLWETKGWSTTVFSATTKAVYDVVAMRDDDRLLLWTVHRPDGGALGATVLRRCATTRDSSQGADRATLVTTGTLTTAARDWAEELGIRVVDCETLVEELDAAGLAAEIR